MDTTDGRVRSGPQSKIPPILFWLVVAAIALRIVTAALDRGKKDEGSGLVRWRPHEKAGAAARREGKPLLYDFTAAWCPPCHRLDTEGWGDSRVASLVNDSYLPARIVDREREEGKNPASIGELQRRYSVTAFPTLVVADPDGREIAKFEGYGGKETLVRFLEESRKKPPHG
jgi:thiol:disulfide interchange protein